LLVVAVSKKLTFLLRHGAAEKGLQLRPDGFAVLADVLSLPGFGGASVRDVERIVEADSKQRFALRRGEDGQLMLRANQGHTLASVQSGQLLRRVQDPAECGACVHGTTKAAWALIRERGLNRMQRNHVHMALDIPNNGKVISGARLNSEVLVFLDAPKMMGSGRLPLFLSENGVVLCEGDSRGTIAPTFFKRAVDAATGQELPCGRDHAVPQAAPTRQGCILTADSRTAKVCTEPPADRVRQGCILTADSRTGRADAVSLSSPPPPPPPSRPSQPSQPSGTGTGTGIGTGTGTGTDGFAYGSHPSGGGWLFDPAFVRASECVLFYGHDPRANGERACLSNWFPAPFVLAPAPPGTPARFGARLRFCNTEQYMMFMKVLVVGR
jgi:2'-phosphotransferase